MDFSIWQYIHQGSLYVAQNERSPSGIHLGCQSAFGLQDMVGSVWEDSKYTDANVLNTPNEVLKEIRGGSWFCRCI